MIIVDSKTKIPSVIIVNIVSPRLDYHGHDKSRIDTHAFSETIIEAAKKIAGSVQTFRGAGFIFTKERHHDIIPENKSKVTPESLVEKMLKKDGVDVRRIGLHKTGFGINLLLIWKSAISRSPEHGSNS